MSRLSKAYDKYKFLFEENKCKLLTSFSEFEKLSKDQRNIQNVHVKYIAICNHENDITICSFVQHNCGRMCKKCTTLDIKKTSKKSDGAAKSTSMEDDGIEYLITILQDYFDIKLSDEGCLTDFVIKPKNINDDKYLQIQLKTTEKAISSYKFTFHCNEYKNHLIICLCLFDKNMWLFNGNDFVVTQGISIGKKDSKYSDNKIINFDDLVKRLTDFYEILPNFTWKEINIPISDDCKKEQEFRRHREQICNFITFAYPTRHGLVYDFTPLEI